MVLRWVLARLFRIGTLTVGIGRSAFTVGGQVPGPSVAVRVRDRVTALKLAVHPDLYLGEAYMDGALTFERGTLQDFLDLCGRNLGPWRPSSLVQRGLAAGLRRLEQINARAAARRNVAHHYDLSMDMYRTFLDADLQYSCAYFPTPDTSLEEAQAAKKRHIAAKLALQPGHKVLDIGCGMGGLAITLAQAADVEVVGITLSREQLRVCTQRAAELGLASRVSFHLMDYRDVEGSFDRIVSVGMFEHVGAPNYRTFFQSVSRLLAPSGVALIHSIGRSTGPTYTSRWIQKYIFPGGYIPALSEVVPAVEQSGLWLTDLEILRMHYAETLKLWREHFQAAAKRVPAGFDDRFRRMWDFYLTSSEMSFRHCGLMVFQAQLARDPHALPLTRDYMVEQERRLAGAPAAKLPELARGEASNVPA